MVQLGLAPGILTFRLQFLQLWQILSIQRSKARFVHEREAEAGGFPYLSWNLAPLV